MMSQAPWRRRWLFRQARALLTTASPRVIDCGDGVRLQGFMSDRARSRGLVVLLHGWEGSAQSSYVLSAGSALLDAGFSVFRLNFRDHGQTHGLNEGLFHSCRLAEVYNAVARLRSASDSRFFAVVGHSLGGNFALRIAARAAAAGLAIDRVLAVCPVLQPQHTMQALDEGLWIYRRYFLARWRRSLAAKAAAFPGRYELGDLNRFRTLSAMTEYFVERYTEFDSLEAYLSGYAVTGDALAPLAVATRIVSAGDDPMIPEADLDRIERPPLLEVSREAHGGHCGFFDRWAGASWIDREVVRDLDVSAYAASAV